MSVSAKYQVNIKSSAERDMNSLPRAVFTKISNAILSLESTPRPVGCKKLRGRIEYRIRVGNYRVLYIINDSIRAVEVVAVGDRKDVYR